MVLITNVSGDVVGLVSDVKHAGEAIKNHYGTHNVKTLDHYNREGEAILIVSVDEMPLKLTFKKVEIFK